MKRPRLTIRSRQKWRGIAEFRGKKFTLVTTAPTLRKAKGNMLHQLAVVCDVSVQLITYLINEKAEGSLKITKEE